MYKYYNSKFLKNIKNPCIIRAFLLACPAIDVSDIDYIKNNWIKILIDTGWEYISIPAKPFKKRMTVSELANNNDKKTMIICNCGDHVVCIIGNTYFDEFDSGNRCVFYYFKKEVVYNETK